LDKALNTCNVYSLFQYQETFCCLRRYWRRSNRWKKLEDASNGSWIRTCVGWAFHDLESTVRLNPFFFISTTFCFFLMEKTQTIY